MPSDSFTIESAQIVMKRRPDLRGDPMQVELLVHPSEGEEGLCVSLHDGPMTREKFVKALSMFAYALSRWRVSE